MFDVKGGWGINQGPNVKSYSKTKLFYTKNVYYVQFRKVGFFAVNFIWMLVLFTKASIQYAIKPN
jgi:hypothetical protein